MNTSFSLKKNQADIEWLVDHFTCIEMEEQEMIGGKKYHHYTHPEGEPDDAFHSFVYAIIADAVERISPTLTIQDLYWAHREDRQTDRMFRSSCTTYKAGTLSKRTMHVVSQQH